MKIRRNYRWFILIALMIAGTWYAISQQNATSGSQAGNTHPATDAPTKTNRTPEEPGATRRSRNATADRLTNVRSPLAKRYLRFLLPGGRLDGDSYDQSIVNNAYNQAWCLTARMDLTEEQQDRLAEFLLQEDFSMWMTMDRARVEEWAKQHLSDEQRAALLAFIEESEQGQRDLSDSRINLKMKEYVVGFPQEAFTTETQDSARIAEILGDDTGKVSEEEKEKARAELRDMAIRPTALSDFSNAVKFEESYKGEHAAQFFHLLADRIPLTEPQQLAIYDALRKGASPPTNAYDYQLRPADQIEAEVRSSTAWMGEVLTKEQYETYLRHYLAEIEMIRFQVSPQ